MSEDINHEFPISRSFNCPYCGAMAQFNLFFPNAAHKNEKEANLQIDMAGFGKREIDYYEYRIWACQVCNSLVFRAYYKRYEYSSYKLIGQFPSHIRIDTGFGKIVPGNILEDFLGALKCYEFGEYRASAALCRRSLQSSVLEQKADPDKKLVQQIDGLNKANPDRFTNDIKNWSHNIRVFGNWGAHPDNDGLKDVDEPTAKEIIEFMKSYFHYVYVMPDKVEKARIKRKSKAKPESSS